MNKLTATKRSKTDKLKIVRNNGMVPAVVYGAQVENTTISVEKVAFEKVFKLVGETSTIVLEINDEKNGLVKVDALIHDIQVDPIKGFPIHVDFLAVDMNKPVEVSVPVEFIGVAKAEKDGLGVLVKIIHELEVEALPKDIPHNIEVDISALETLDSQILVKDITLPKGVLMKTGEDEVIALIAPMKEEVQEENASVDLSAIEVEKKGKKEDEGEENKE
ncbi:MAG: 50S ribosomal protein L25 [Candidatus Pacebacteria bacterium]|nr:50S ribosomal protein L25 [Candidatus Paceibacterota bacterium]